MTPPPVPEDEPTLPDGADPLFDEATPPARRVGGRYTLEEPLGAGGGAVVWRGYDEVLGRTVAVKVLRPDLARDPAASERLRREAAVAARVPHPGIVQVYDVGTTPEGAVWVALEHVEGPTLLEVLRHHPEGMEPRLAAAIAEQTADALGEAHALGLVHRDVKPANLLLSPDGVVKITDFGVATSAGDGHRQEATVHGTPSYAAPEQLAGDTTASAPTVDVFALGVVLHECLTGRPAFPRGEARRHPTPLPPRRVRPDVPRDLDRVVSAATAADPGARPADGHALALALRPLVDADPHGLVRELVAEVQERTRPRGGPAAGRAEAPRPTAGGRTVGTVVLLAVLAVLLGQLLLADDGGSSAEPLSTDAGVPVRAAAVLDPYGSIGRTPTDPVLALDGDEDTAWTTPSYPVPLRSLGTPGVGIWLDLGEPVGVRSVELTLGTGAVTVELLAADAPPGPAATEADWESVARVVAPGPSAELSADGRVARYWAVWFTELEPVGESWQAALTDIRFHPLGT